MNEFDLTGEFAFVPVAIVAARVLGPIAVRTAVKHGPIIKRSITGYSRHALGRTIGTRGGPQMSPRAAEYIVANGRKTLDARRGSIKYDHWLGRVLTNKQGRLITVISKSRLTRYIR